MTAPTTYTSRAMRTVLSKHFCRLALPSLLLAALSSPLAFAQADEHSEVNRLARTGQVKEALIKADRYLATKPSDPLMRFTKGVIQIESGKHADAIATFTKLTEDFPELPEPYNNLAVLYSNSGQIDKARNALEMAIRTNPSYATAHENLGDIYAKLATQAYSKALQLDAGKTALTPKLNLIRGLFVGNATKAVATAAAPVPLPATVTPPTPTPTPARTEPAPVSKPVIIKPEVKPADPDANDLIQDKQGVELAVRSWAKAWASKNVPDYLAAYAPSFKPPANQSRSEWEAARKARIVPRSSISVELNHIVVTVNGNKATARFHQTYRSDGINKSSRKSLELIRMANRWLIVQESAGS